MATPVEDPSIEDVGPEDESEVVQAADRLPSDWQIMSVYEKLNKKLSAGMTLPKMKADHTLAKFVPGNCTLGISGGWGSERKESILEIPIVR